MADDDDHQISYQALPRGVPVHAADGARIGTVHRVLDNAREHIFDGIVIDTGQRAALRRRARGRAHHAQPRHPHASTPPRPPTPAADPARQRTGRRWRALGSPAVSLPTMDAYLAVVSRREVRDYVARPLEPEVEHGILDAGRLAGSAKNRQPWTFLVVRDDGAVEAVAESVFEPGNIRGAAFVVAVHMAGGAGIDAGPRRPEHAAGRPRAGRRLLPQRHQRPRRRSTAPCASTTTRRSPPCCSFGYPAKPRDPARRSAGEWIERANRKPYDDVVKEI